MTPSEKRLERMGQMDRPSQAQPWGRKMLQVGFGSGKSSISDYEYELRWKLAFGTKEEKAEAKKLLDELEQQKPEDK